MHYLKENKKVVSLIQKKQVDDLVSLLRKKLKETQDNTKHQYLNFFGVKAKNGYVELKKSLDEILKTKATGSRGKSWF